MSGHQCAGPTGPGLGCSKYEHAAAQLAAALEACRAARTAAIRAATDADTAEEAWLEAQAYLRQFEREPGIPACWARPTLRQQMCEDVDGPGAEWVREAGQDGGI